MPIYDSNLPVVLKKVLESPEHKKMFKGIFDTAVQLVALGDKRGYEIDMHLDNIMLRGNTPVITDPWVADFREVKDITQSHLIPSFFAAALCALTTGAGIGHVASYFVTSRSMYCLTITCLP